MNNSIKSLITLFSILIIFSALLIYNKEKLADIVNSNISNLSKTLVGAPVLDWQTYTNMEYGYKIKYPKGYYVDTRLSKPFSEDYETASTEFAGDTTISNYPEFKAGDEVPMDYLGIRLGFWKLPTGSHVTMDEYVNWMLPKADGLQRFDLNGTPAASYRTHGYTNDGKHERIVQPTIISIKGDNIAVIGYTYLDGTDNQTMMPLANEIIRTFTFIK